LSRGNQFDRITVRPPSEYIPTAPELSRFKTQVIQVDGAGADSLIAAAIVARECPFTAIEPSC
jgi:hypothetical protein